MKCEHPPSSIKSTSESVKCMENKFYETRQYECELLGFLVIWFYNM